MQCDDSRCSNNDGVVVGLYQVTLIEARRVQLSDDDACDCAMEMVLYALQQVQQIQHIQRHPQTTRPEVQGKLGYVSSSAYPVLRDDLRDEHAARWLRRSLAAPLRPQFCPQLPA